MARDEDREIAYEQYLYWRHQGLTHHEMLAVVGYPRVRARELSSSIVVEYLAMAHRQLMRRMLLLGEAA